MGFKAAPESPTRLSNNVLLREQVANNVAIAGEQQLNDLAYHQNIVVTVPGNTRFYIVLAKTTGSGVGTERAGSAPAGNPGGASGFARPPPSVQELRELMELRRELTQMYQQQQKAQIAQDGSRTAVKTSREEWNERRKSGRQWLPLNRMMQRPASHRKQSVGSDFQQFAKPLQTELN